MRNANRVAKTHKSNPQANQSRISGTTATNGATTGARIKLLEMIEAIAARRAMLEDSLAELQSVHELIRFNPALRQEADALAGLTAFWDQLCTLRAWAESI